MSGSVPQATDVGRQVLYLEEQVRRHDGAGRQAAEGFGIRE